MILVLKNTTKKLVNKSKKLNINTLIPYFEFKNSKGKIVKPKNCCVAL